MNEANLRGAMGRGELEAMVAEVGEANISPCVVCQVAFAEFAKIAGNKTDLEHLQEALDKKCDSLHLSPTITKVCEAIVNKTVAFLPKIAKFVYQKPYSPFAWCSILSVCPVDCCETDTQPEQIHVAQGKTYETMTVTWVTGQPTPSTTVQWGTSPDSLSNTAMGAVRTYTISGWHGIIHHATMTGLKPKTRYFYRVGDPNKGMSDVMNCTTLWAGNGTMTFAVIGDMGLDNSNETMQYLASEATSGAINGILHVGDISYADAYQRVWDQYLRKIQPTASQLPYQVVPGNHEIWEGFASYKHRFQMPGAETRGSPGNMYYSFDAGLVHVIGYSTESVIDTPWISPDQVAWLQADLAAANANRANVPWIVMMGHRPLYCGTHDGPNCEQFSAYLRKTVEDIIYKAKVDLVIAGHVHNYERMWPTYNGAAVSQSYVNPTAPVYVINGAAGNREGLQKNFVNPQPSWSAFRAAEFGYAHLTIANATAMTFSFYADANRVLLDEFTIVKT
eukprot:TRINITY_DN64461_c0_g1_i1.p1 TRINITY_DN64461_c0_g1~~TRINITY_DN64461_c0_g1_i1.p1  ORF type:complete len:506 (+),score=250.15 TRINITY_DN64461_c0_g1_i1:239-1756(+)